MSRCFPFPPPGYEKKARPDDTDFLKKEKQREKRHKKERKDKEKRESKEKKEKDRNEGKEREKKEKKEKHRDKKKDKEKERDKDKITTSIEKKLEFQSQNYNGETVIQKEKEKDRDKNGNNPIEKKFAMQSEGQNGQKLGQNRKLASEYKDSKFVQELGRRIKGEEKGIGAQLVDKHITGTDQKRDEGILRFVDKKMTTAEKEKSKERKIDEKITNFQEIRDESRFSGNTISNNHVRSFLDRVVVEMPKQAEKSIEKKMEGKEKTKEKDGADKRKDRDREKKREKEKKKEEKAKEKIEQKSTMQLNKVNKNDLLATQNIITSKISKETKRPPTQEENLGKRKEVETNGFLHDSEIRPNKLPRTSSSSHLLTENGRKLEPCQNPANNLHADNKEKRHVNGVIEAPLFSIAKGQANDIPKSSSRPPHPDLKYLTEVLSIPKAEEWSEFDEQDWLFDTDKAQLEKTKMDEAQLEKKSKLDSLGDNKSPRVWAEAMQIDSADIVALPYVIPY